MEKEKLKDLKDQKEVIGGLVKSAENQVDKLNDLIGKADRESWHYCDLVECLSRASKNLKDLKNYEESLKWDIEDYERAVDVVDGR